MNLRVCFVLLSIAVAKSYGQLRCYACTFTSNDADQSCLTITSSTPTVECEARYCTIIRQEFLDPAGAVSSFGRGCNDNPDFLNHELEDAFFRTYYRACTMDLCNIGNGIQSIAGLDPNQNQNRGPNLLVPGTGGSAGIHANAFVLIFVSILLVLRVV